MMLDAPQDDVQARRDVRDQLELKPIKAAYSDIIQTRLWPLKLDGVAKFFGPKLDKQPDDMVLPLFAGDEIYLSGLNIITTGEKSHTDFHAVGDIGYVECFYDINGTRLETALFYLRPDDKFVPLKSINDFSQRLEWDKAKFAALEKWFDEHMPKVTDLGVVEVSESSPTRVDLGAGMACIITVRDIHTPNVPLWFDVDLAKETTNTEERLKSMQYKSIDRPGQSVGFSFDGKFYRLISQNVGGFRSRRKFCGHVSALGLKSVNTSWSLSPKAVYESGANLLY